MEHDLNQVLNQLKQLPVVSPKFCDNCGTAHNDNDFKIIGQNDGASILQISCSRCHVLYLLKINPNTPGIAVQRLELPNTDITPEEFDKFAGLPQVDKEEALEAFMDMKKVDTIEEFLNLFS